MPISLPGKLRIKRINGSNGSFCVGDLETEIGEFRVKDAVLDQFDEGVYTGQFWIQQIFPWSYSSYGRMVIEVRAKLADLQIDGQQRAGSESREPQEPDPASESTPPVAPVAPEPPQTPQPAVQSTRTQRSTAPRRDEPQAPDTPEKSKAPARADDDADRQLFGPELQAQVAALEPVKLDPTIERMQFRRQRQRLKEELGYEFKSATQTWYPPGHPMLQ